MSLSTHVLDTARGEPARGVRVRLERADEVLATEVTDADGRIREWPDPLAPGTYRLVFETGAYLGDGAFFPEVVVTFAMADESHHHVPLLLSPYGYSTYRGS